MSGSTSGYPISEGKEWLKNQLGGLRTQIGEVRSLAQAAKGRAEAAHVAVGDLPYAPWDIADASFAISAAAGTWQAVTGAAILTFGPLTRDLEVIAHYSGNCVGNGSAYAMVGVLLTGAITAIGEDNSFMPGGINPDFSLTPFSNAASSITLTGAKRVIIPAGPAVNFQLGARRNIASAVSMNYGRLEVDPVRWRS